jgi:hypothetical protein
MNLYEWMMKIMLEQTEVQKAELGKKLRYDKSDIES